MNIIVEGIMQDVYAVSRTFEGKEQKAYFVDLYQRTNNQKGTVVNIKFTDDKIFDGLCDMKKDGKLAPKLTANCSTAIFRDEMYLNLLNFIG